MDDLSKSIEELLTTSLRKLAKEKNGSDSTIRLAVKKLRQS